MFLTFDSRTHSLSHDKFKLENSISILYSLLYTNLSHQLKPHFKSEPRLFPRVCSVKIRTLCTIWRGIVRRDSMVTAFRMASGRRLYDEVLFRVTESRVRELGSPCTTKIEYR